MAGIPPAYPFSSSRTRATHRDPRHSATQSSAHAEVWNTVASEALATRPSHAARSGGDRQATRDLSFTAPPRRAGFAIGSCPEARRDRHRAGRGRRPASSNPKSRSRRDRIGNGGSRFPLGRGSLRRSRFGCRPPSGFRGSRARGSDRGNSDR